PLNDIAIIKIEAGDDLPYVEFGDSSNLKVGQTVIAIGNALGEFRNTVSTGVISGLSRSITAGGAGFGTEQLVGVIQTDASVNPGNSGGPLLNIAGQAIGINTAIAQGAENIGFAIPINEVKNIYDNVKQYGRIVRPWLGVRYMPITKAIAEANKLEVDYGVLIVRGEARTDLAVIPGSPADKAGLVENDIILEVNGQKLDENNLLSKVIAQLNPGDKVKLKVLHKGEEKIVEVVLEEMK
ncbi:MAG: trypsin-like peptidase domain-containing protein, partial [Patescibacteria group bacterium]